MIDRLPVVRLTMARHAICYGGSCRGGQRGYVLITVLVTLVILSAIVLLMNRESGMNVVMVRGAQQAASADYVVEAGMQHAIWSANSSACSGYALPSTAFGADSYSASYTPTSGSPVSIIATAQTKDGITRNLQRDRVPVYEKTIHMVLQPDAATAKDTYLYMWKSDWNFGLATDLWVDNNFPDSLARSLLQFQLDSLPAAAHILSATLELYQGSAAASGGQVGVRRITTSWNEGSKSGAKGDTAHWLESATATSWTTPGGDYDSQLYAKASVPAGVKDWVSWDVTALISDWHGKVFPNDGMILSAEASATGAYFSSSDHADPLLHPKLTIIYRCECGVDCGAAPAPLACSADYLADTKLSEFSTSAYGSGTQKDLDYLPEGVSFLSVVAPSGGAWLSVDTSSDKFYMTDMAGNLLASAPGSASMGGVSYVPEGPWADHVFIVDFGSDEGRYYDMAGNLASSFSLSGLMVDTPSGAGYIGNTVSGVHDQRLAITDRSKQLVYILDQAGILKVTFDVSAFGTGPTDVAHIPGTDKLLILDESKKAYILVMDGSSTGEYDLSGFGTSGTVGLAINPLTCDHVIGDDGVDKVIALNVTAGEPPPGPGSGPVTLGTVADTYLHGTNTSNFGAADAIMSGRDNGGPLLYGLARFDVSSIPAGTSVTSATLRLYQFASNRSGSMDIGVHRVDQDWTEGGANWTTSDGSVAWSGGVGGTYSNPAVNTTSVTIGTYGWYEWNVTSLVQEWVDGVAPNYGVELVYVTVNAGRNVSFASKEHADTTLRPQLVVEYGTP